METQEINELERKIRKVLTGFKNDKLGIDETVFAIMGNVEKFVDDAIDKEREENPVIPFQYPNE